MKTTIPITITSEEAIILQQISESGEEDVISLARGLRMNRARVMQTLDHLKHKGLITIKATYGDWWVRTSAKGTRLVRYMWPEMQMSY
jgi:DNA-binding MarR family transcriptional regulator